MQTAKLIALLSVVNLAQASSLQLPTQSDNLTISRLEAIQAQTVLYEAQVARARALQELQKSGGEMDNTKPFNPLPPTTDPSIPLNQTLPQIIQITGNGKSFSALLMLPNGNQVTVSNGSDIPGTAWKVSKITLNQVIVSNTSTARSLNFSG